MEHTTSIGIRVLNPMIKEKNGIWNLRIWVVRKGSSAGRIGLASSTISHSVKFHHIRILLLQLICAINIDPTDSIAEFLWEVKSDENLSLYSCRIVQKCLRCLLKLLLDMPCLNVFESPREHLPNLVRRASSLHFRIQTSTDCM